MKKVKVNLKENSYDILMGANLFPQLGGYLKKMGYKGPAVIITNTLVKGLYAEYVGELLSREGFEVSLLSVEDGEAYKSMDSAMQLYAALNELKVERTTLIIAVGGGVIGDLAGFVAATYMRGLPLVHVPTTLLAQVDSSIGGKVAVDFNKYKNIIGAFYQPKLVLSDISCLRTLQEIEVVNGLSEIIKYGIISDPQLFTFASLNLNLIRRFDITVLEEVISRSAYIKANIVSEDELDNGLRNILNFGHTAGHAIETVSDFSVKHGYAVAVGMMVAAKIAVSMGMFNKAELLNMKETFEGAGLPASLADLNMGYAADNILEAMGHDKKVRGGKIRFILPRTVGSVQIADNVSVTLVKQVLESNQ